MARSSWMYLAYLVQILVGLNVFYAVTRGAWDEVPTGIFLFAVALVPYLITWKTRISFPWFVYFLISLAILIHLSGYVRGRYLAFAHWDTIAHIVSGSMVALIGFVAILFIDRMRGYKLDALAIGVFALFLGLVGEYVWEIFEFTIDQTIGGSLAGLMQADNYDTMTDMIFVLIPSAVIGLVSWYYVERNGKEKILDEMLKESDIKF